MTTEPHAKPPAPRLNRAMSMAMVVGTMIGSGIYLLPTTLAPFGPNILAAFAVTIGGTMTPSPGLPRGSTAGRSFMSGRRLATPPRS